MHDRNSQAVSTSNANPLAKVTEISGNKASKISSKRSGSSTEKLTSKLIEITSPKLLQPLDSPPRCGDSIDKSSSRVLQPQDKYADLAATPAATSSHMRRSLEPIRTQIITYLTLLRKMTTNHP